MNKAGNGKSKTRQADVWNTRKGYLVAQRQIKSDEIKRHLTGFNSRNNSYVLIRRSKMNLR
jgi:hypothetical protein